MVGILLSTKLLAKGYRVHWLSRNAKNKAPLGVQVFAWNPTTHSMDLAAFEGIDTIIHLAGENIGAGRWTTEQRERILKSRTESSATLLKGLGSTQHQVTAFLSASGIGYYGYHAGDHPAFTEESPLGTGFQTEVCEAWEKGVAPVTKLGIRLVINRIAVVLSKRGGALPKMLLPIRLGQGPIGGGQQMMSWITEDDLTDWFVYATEHTNCQGVYNLVAPEVVSNKQLTYAIANTVGAFIWNPWVPAFGVNLAFGEMAILVTKGSRVVSKKIGDTGFQFQYPQLSAALQHILK